MSRNGNWICLRCGNENYASRVFCNMRKCGARRDGSGSGENWICVLCGNENFPSRTMCNRKTCGAPRESADMKNSAPQIPQLQLQLPPQQPQFTTTAPNPNWPLYYPYPYAITLPSTLPSAPLPNMQALSGVLSGNTAVTTSGTLPTVMNNASLIPSLPISALWPYNPIAAALYPLTGTYPPPIVPDLNTKKRLNSDINGYSDTFREAKRKKQTNRVPQEGDWTCPKCGNLNWPTRTKCNMKKCATPKPDFTNFTTNPIDDITPKVSMVDSSTRELRQTLVEPGS